MATEEITQEIEKTNSSTQAFIMTYSNQMRGPISEMRRILLEMKAGGSTKNLGEARLVLSKMEGLLDKQVQRLISL